MTARRHIRALAGVLLLWTLAACAAPQTLSLIKDPGKTLAKFDLTDEEKDAIINVHTSVGVVGGNAAALDALNPYLGLKVMG